jgi:hypothetical protein
MIAKIEVWFDKSYKCWYVKPYNEENNPYDAATQFHKKVDAIKFAKSLLPTLVIENRK